MPTCAKGLLRYALIITYDIVAGNRAGAGARRGRNRGRFDLLGIEGKHKERNLHKLQCHANKTKLRLCKTG